MGSTAWDWSGPVRSALGLVVVLLTGAVVARSGLVVPSEPSDSFVPSVIAIGAGLALLVAGAWAGAARKGRAAALIAVVLVASTAVAFAGESLRWRWSEAELRAVVEDPGSRSACDRLNPCRVGWWSIGEVVVLESGTYLQSPAVVPSCEGGGLALLTDGATSEDMVRELEAAGRGPLVNVDPERNGWYSVCLYS